MGKKESDANKKKIVEAEGEGEAVGSDGGHDDAAADKELIQKMLDEYIGKDDKMEPKEREAMAGLAREAYQAHKEMGAKENEAYERAGHAIKLAKHMASKQAEAEVEGEVEVDKIPPKGKAKDAKDIEGETEIETDACADDDNGAKKESEKIKSLTKKLLESQGRIAALESKFSKDEVSKYVETKLADSKQPRAITKKFREAAGEIKSKADFDSMWKLFLEGVKNSRVELDWGLLQEKTTTGEDGKKTEGAGLDFSTCLED